MLIMAINHDVLPPYNSLNVSIVCKLKTFHKYYKALYSFGFANKESIIRKTSWKFPMHYVNTTFFNILGYSLPEKGKYFVIESYICVE